MTGKLAFVRLTSLALACGVALGAGTACGGATTVDTIDGPQRSPSGDPPPSTPPSTSETPKAKPIPPQPVGPYTGLVGTTDVSILYPLPVSGESTDFLRPTAVGNHGELLPQAFADIVLPVGRALERTKSLPPSGFGQLALVSLRLDPCAARGVVTGSCRSEVRAVFQALYDKPAGEEGDPVAGTAATDGAIHVMYDVDDAELVTMMKEILTLKKANGDLALQELAPHPILAAQGLGGAFAQGLRNIVLSHVGADRIGRVTVFDHNMDPDQDGWTFEIFDRAGATLEQKDIPGLAEAPSQMVAGTNTATPLEESNAQSFVGSSAKDSVAPLVDSMRPAPGTAEAAALQTAFDAVLRVQNPTVHSAETTHCANCHLAEGARRIGEGVYGLDASQAFSHARSLAYTSEKPSVTNLHAFGYLHRKVSIMLRTANESVVVANAMESKIK